MSFITGKHIPRRTFLRGVGATVALPFLDAMVPAGRAYAKTRAADRTRLICIEEVHGLAGCNNWAATKFMFAPQAIATNVRSLALCRAHHAFTPAIASAPAGSRIRSDSGSARPSESGNVWCSRWLSTARSIAVL